VLSRASSGREPLGPAAHARGRKRAGGDRPATAWHRCFFLTRPWVAICCRLRGATKEHKGATIMATLTVTTRQDVVDANDGKLSLREAVALTWGLGCQDAQSSMVIISWWCGGGPEVKGAAASAGLRSGTLELGDGSARHWCLACAAVPAGQALSGKLTTSDPRGSSPSRPTAASAAQPHIRPGSFGP
jgi:hypothetical protein